MSQLFSGVKRIPATGLLFLFLVSIFLPASVLTAPKGELGKQCRVGRLDCNIGSCEDSSQPQSDDNFCDCDMDSDCAEEYVDDTDFGETWSCIDGADATYDLDYCKSSTGKIRTPIPPKDPSFLDTILDTELTLDEIKKMTSKPVTKINIPGLTYSEPKITVEDGVTYQHLPYLGDYISAVYKYLVLALSIVTVVVIIVSGLGWITSGGNSAQIEAAKERIGKAIIGLLITIGSYTILYVINPELVAFKSLKVQYVDTEPLNSGHSVKDEERIIPPPCKGAKEPSMSSGFGTPSFEKSEDYACGNRDLKSTVTYLVIHEGTRGEDTIGFLASKGLSTHYEILRDGRVIQGVDLRRRARHAGAINHWSVGVDMQMPKDCSSSGKCVNSLECSSKCSYTNEQYNSLNGLINHLTQVTGITKTDKSIIGHCQVWGTDHGDPRNLDWGRLGLDSTKHRIGSIVNGRCIVSFDEATFNNLKNK